MDPALRLQALDRALIFHASDDIPDSYRVLETAEDFWDFLQGSDRTSDSTSPDASE